MTNNGIEQAEQRVREMNRMAQQYSERGNSFMRQSLQPPQGQPRFEQVNHPSANGRDRRNPQQNMLRSNMPQESARHMQRNNLPRIQDGQKEKNPHREDFSGNNFGLAGLALDNEKLLIILIMYLLIKEKADMKLILALGYLLF